MPSNVIGCEQFAGILDGFSIGSNDLTQLTLGVDRDSELINRIFDEHNPQAKEMIALENSGFADKREVIFLNSQSFLFQQDTDSISFNPNAD